MPAKQIELEFPLVWHGKIIGHASPELEPRLREALVALQIENPLRPSNVSSGGKYASFSLTMIFEDRATMDRVTETLAAVEGVRYVI